ncbi:Hypothetical protein, putative [Bodo saltans]|uniref:Uncharacterized protein n=1 Tax=Bodo saltans TaxID=75058 RepID=A0A0S4JLT5_BODSA|nr:Hypothetical protein, putative [Bodo saltans]|eukprot:CUG90881.1 Hypothetical protein, putative [Bodo saltans]
MCVLEVWWYKSSLLNDCMCNCKGAASVHSQRTLRFDLSSLLIQRVDPSLKLNPSFSNARSEIGRIATSGIVLEAEKGAKYVLGVFRSRRA